LIKAGTNQNDALQIEVGSEQFYTLAEFCSLKLAIRHPPLLTMMMKTTFLFHLLIAAVTVALLSGFSHAFQVVPKKSATPRSLSFCSDRSVSTASTASFQSRRSNVMVRHMSADIEDEGLLIGATERLLLAAKIQREQGLRQDYGVTIKKDGWDGVRAVVWTVFGVTQLVLPVLAVALTCGLALNAMGYGYFFDVQTGNFVVDSLDHIRQEQLFQLEINKLVVGSRHGG
jgi:hypothetical protein